MTIKDLEKVFQECKENNLAICVAVTIPGRKTAEIIVNHPDNFDYKLEYYKEAYDENLVLKRNKDIRIESAFPVNFFMNEDDINETEEQAQE